MTTINPEFVLKGDEFLNRYRIEGTLTTTSPLHIGTGEARTESLPEDQSRSDEEHHVDEIARDWRGLPYLPGSALRGVLRHYLWHIFHGFGRAIVPDPNQAAPENQEKAIAYMRTRASLLEQVFGTSFAEGKVEFWDAPLTQKAEDSEGLDVKGWEPKRQSYVVRSVAIDPETGAAEAQKLYAFDVVPPGAQFTLTLTGQNLTDVELGFLLFGLYGWNSDICSLTIGAMAGRGFGRMTFTLDEIACVNDKNIAQWVTEALNTEHAGYESLIKIDENTAKKQFLKAFKEALTSLPPL